MYTYLCLSACARVFFSAEEQITEINTRSFDIQTQAVKKKITS